MRVYLIALFIAYILFWFISFFGADYAFKNFGNKDNDDYTPDFLDKLIFSTILSVVYTIILGVGGLVIIGIMKLFNLM